MFMHERVRHLVATILILSASACSDGDDGKPAGPVEEDLVTVAGEVTRIEDMVPADGGVTIDVKQDTGKIVVLRYASLFTHPQPSQEHVALYQVLRNIHDGDRVSAKGVQTSDGIDLRGLTILQ
jgi:hypothetical protein